MKVKFLFSSIKNMDKLYSIEMVDSPFGGEDKAPAYEYIGDTYCSNAVTEVVSKIADIQGYSYEGSFERIAKEVFVISSVTRKYIVSFTIDTYNHEKVRMLVGITYQNEEADKWIVSPFLDNLFKVSKPDTLWGSNNQVRNESSGY